MKPTVSSINRRMLLATLTVLPALPAGLSTTTRAQDAANTLGSWNNGGAKQAIIDFVRTTTDHSSGKFVPASERTAVFDQDGTLWVEHPMYIRHVLPRTSADTGEGKAPIERGRTPKNCALWKSGGDRQVDDAGS